MFLGVVVNPKTKEPVFVQRSSDGELYIDILIAQKAEGKVVYETIGVAYLQDNSEPHSDYLNATAVTGFPRVHTPDGLEKAFKNQGYGTSLYIATLLLATARAERLMRLSEIAGDGAGICSESKTRSESASAWWAAAVERGLARTMSGESGNSTPETETLEDEDLTDYMSSRGRQKSIDAIQEAVGGYSEWYPTNISIRGDVEREVERHRDIEADYITYDLAKKKNLIAVLNPVIGDLAFWAKDLDEASIDDAAQYTSKAVILGLNVAHQATEVVGKLAMLALAAGATETEVTRLVTRNRLGVDKLTFAPHVSAYSPDRFKPNPEPRRTKLPPRIKRVRPEPVVFAHNPAPEPTEAQYRDLVAISRDLDERRAALGWADLEDMP